MARDLDVGYLGVIVDDRDPQSTFDAMITTMQERLGDAWSPANASLEVVLAEAFSVAIADWIYATNRSTGALVEAVLALYGVPRDDGASAEGSLSLTFDGSVTDTIAEGDAFVTDDGITLLAVRDTPVSGTSVTVDVQEAEPGAGANLAAGDELSPVVGIPQLSTCTLSAALSGGRPAEDDLTYLARAATRLRRVTSSLVVAEHFTAYALEDARVGRAHTIDQWNGTSETAADGHVTVVLYGKGAALSAETLAELQTAIVDASASILTVHVIAADRPTVAVTATITVSSGYTEADVITACEDTVDAYLAWDNAGFGQTVTPAALEALLGNVPGVATVSVSAPSGDVTHDEWEIPAPGTVSISV